MPDQASHAAIADELARLRAGLLNVSHEIHAHPELAFEEHHAHDALCDSLAAAGLTVERGYLDVPTAFRADAGSGDGPLVAILCEYDALPEIGHACGHNIIAAAGLGAGLIAAALADRYGGRVSIIGTPAEEGGGGKIVLADRGAFAGVDVAMMVHPADADYLWMDSLAIEQVDAHYFGEAAHAAAAPSKGRNALDAAVLGYVNVAALRQHIESDERVHGIISRGGDKPNIVPHDTASSWYVRSPTTAGVKALGQRVQRALEAGAAATGCTCELTWGERATAYFDVRDNHAVLDVWARNLAVTGRVAEAPGPGRRVIGSTDMGNISYLVPSIHPMIQVAPAGVPIHSAPFATHAGGPGGDRAVIDATAAMAATVLDLWTDPTVLAAARSEFAGQGGHEVPCAAAPGP